MEATRDTSAGLQSNNSHHVVIFISQVLRIEKTPKATWKNDIIMSLEIEPGSLQLQHENACWCGNGVPFPACLLITQRDTLYLSLTKDCL